MIYAILNWIWTIVCFWFKLLVFQTPLSLSYVSYVGLPPQPQPEWHDIWTAPNVFFHAGVKVTMHTGIDITQHAVDDITLCVRIDITLHAANDVTLDDGIDVTLLA